MKTAAAIVLATIMATSGLFGEATGQAPPTPVEEQPEVLTRGPVNEAFAQPVNLEDQQGLETPTAPPADINELPPETTPADPRFTWVPGYWAWDSERNDYIWVSGCWRVGPPGMSWVPGYWAQSPKGWRWVSGFWAAVGNNEIEYLPAPPATPDIEPPESPPSPDRIWVPPCWYWYRDRYILRDGYWIEAQRDWVWVPSHYVWTPRGYAFSPGHWDYVLDQRGVLFAPVYFPRPLYSRPGFSYSLSIVVDAGNLEFGMFTYPRYCHYYFGDYYDSLYIGIGIYPWYECRWRRHWYDPIYVHEHWRHRRDKTHWDEHQRREYQRRREDKSLRPPRTYREMEARASKMPDPQRRGFEFASPMKRVADGKNANMRFLKADPQRYRQITRHADDVRKYGEERRQWESRGHGGKQDRRETGNAPSGDSRKTAPPAHRQGWDAKPSDRNNHNRYAPGEQMRRGESQGADRKEQKSSQERQQQKSIQERQQQETSRERQQQKSIQERQQQETSRERRQQKSIQERQHQESSQERRQQKPAAPYEYEKHDSDRQEYENYGKQRRESEQYSPSRVKIPNSPVYGGQDGGSYRKGPPPSHPSKEQRDMRWH